MYSDVAIAGVAEIFTMVYRLAKCHAEKSQRADGAWGAGQRKYVQLLSAKERHY